MPTPILILALAAAAADPGPPGPGELEELSAEATRWVGAMRDHHRPHARPLDRAERAAFAGFFAPALLDRCRLRRVAALDNPDFLTRLFTDRGRPLPIDFRRASGLALVDTILLIGPRPRPGSSGWLTLLFHELVHLAQVEVLGEEGHVGAYVRGWAGHGYSYRAIPQEEQAYELAARFAAAPGRPFPVADEVLRRFGAGRSPRAVER